MLRGGQDHGRVRSMRQTVLELRNLGRPFDRYAQSRNGIVLQHVAEKPGRAAARHGHVRDCRGNRVEFCPRYRHGPYRRLCASRPQGGDGDQGDSQPEWEPHDRFACRVSTDDSAWKRNVTRFRRQAPCQAPGSRPCRQTPAWDARGTVGREIDAMRLGYAREQGASVVWVDRCSAAHVSGPQPVRCANGASYRRVQASET